MATTPKDIDYKTYLRLPELLAAQQPISGTSDKPFAHDEMLFIVVHQTYELWFKQVLFEIKRVQDIFSRDKVADKDLRIVFAGLARVGDILKHLVKQVDLLETMTPLDFLDFRHVFRSASGFQSMQFRELEIRLGLRAGYRLTYGGKSYESYLSPEDQAVVAEIEKQGSVFDQVEKWLARTPFINMGSFDFWQAYRKAVIHMVETDKLAATVNAGLSKDARRMEIEKLDGVQKQFELIFAENPAERMPWRLSMKALQAALFIMLYRDQPILQAPFKILNALMDIDETMTLWRYRHALMAQRMLGMKMGSGGSSGHDYLTQAAAKNRIFTDLFALSTFMIPRSALPQLPHEVEENLGFRYGT